MSTHTSTLLINGTASNGPVPPAGDPNFVRKVCGVLVVDDRRTNQAICGASSSTAERGLVLGSLLIERDMTGEELRRAIISTIPSMPRNFSFLTKDGWPITRTQELKLNASAIINDRNGLLVRQIYEKPRIGIVTVSGDAICSVFADYLQSVKDFRTCVDTALYESLVSQQQHSKQVAAKAANDGQSNTADTHSSNNSGDTPNSSVTLPAHLAYRFIDNNGWPVNGSQEDKLNVLNLIINQNICIKFIAQNTNGRLKHQEHINLNGSGGKHKPLAIEAPPAISNDNLKKFKDISHAQKNQTSQSISYIKQPLGERNSDGPFLSKVYDSTADQPDGFSSIFRRRTRLSRFGDPTTDSIRFSAKKPSIRFRTLKSAKQIAKQHTIMLSYARQEAAQHALDLKEKLISYGYQVYLDVHEITSGTDWQDSLNNAVNNCVVFVPLVTPMYGKTQWTNREVKLADLKKKHIVPINFLESWPPECLAIQFATTQYISWRPEESDHKAGSADAAEIAKEIEKWDIKLWPDVYVHRCAKMIASEVQPLLIKEKPTKKVNFTQSVKKKEIDTTEKVYDAVDSPTIRSKEQENLVVISAHPQQRALATSIRSVLAEEGFQVWCSTDGMFGEDTMSNTESALSSPTTPTNPLLTITEDKELHLNDAYKAYARRIVESKQRPISLPPIDNGPQLGPNSPTTPPNNIDLTSAIISNAALPASYIPSKPKLSRMISQLSELSHLSSLTPEKKERLKQFQDKVAGCGVVIVIVSDAFYKSRTSQQHVYYCEHRKKVIVVKADMNKPPCWFNLLMGSEYHVSANNSRYIEVIRGYIKRTLDPLSAPIDDVYESRMQYLVRNMKKNMPYLGTCVYIAGSTKLFESERNKAICDAIGTQLAEVKNVTLVTSGFNGVPDYVAQAFKAALEKANEGNVTEELNNRIVHVLPVKDEQDFSDKCNQAADGAFNAKTYGRTLFLGESVQEREATLARLLDTCILIEGGQATAREVEEFIWNDHFVIPVMSTGGAAGGEFNFKNNAKIFECPHGVHERDWRMLANKEATPQEVARAVVHCVVQIKKNIADHARQRLEVKAGAAASKFKSKLRRSSKKKTAEKLDVETAAKLKADESALSSPPSPDKVLPLNPIDTVDKEEKETDPDEKSSTKSPSRWIKFFKTKKAVT